MYGCKDPQNNVHCLSIWKAKMQSAPLPSIQEKQAFKADGGLIKNDNDMHER